VTSARVAEAFSRARSHDAVFGPAPGRGYWLIGLETRPPRSAAPVENVAGRRKHALADTGHRLPDQPPIAKVATLRDVDAIDDLPRTKRGAVATLVEA